MIKMKAGACYVGYALHSAHTETCGCVCGCVCVCVCVCVQYVVCAQALRSRAHTHSLSAVCSVLLRCVQTVQYDVQHTFVP